MVAVPGSYFPHDRRAGYGVEPRHIARAVSITGVSEPGDSALLGLDREVEEPSGSFELNAGRKPVRGSTLIEK